MSKQKCCKVCYCFIVDNNYIKWMDEFYHKKCFDISYKGIPFDILKGRIK